MRYCDNVTRCVTCKNVSLATYNKTCKIQYPLLNTLNIKHRIIIVIVPNYLNAHL